MSIKMLNPGKHVPDEINVVIEIAAYAPVVKYEVDKETGLLSVDRFMSTAMFYPCNYGYVPKTLAEDGDPIDVLVITPVSLMPGSVICVRPLGVLRMEDEGGKDSKILTVPVSKLTREYDSIQTYSDLPMTYLKNIEHFFAHYKDNEPNKWSKISGWGTLEEAKKEILAASIKFA